jgi:arylsulfatase A-like enzyme
VTRAGSTIPQLVSGVDTYATVLGMLGLSRPVESPSTSRDFSRLLRGDSTGWADTVFAEYTPDQIGALRFVRMIRTPAWKLVRTYLDPGASELYDLRSDPQEMRNLYHSRQPIGWESDSGQTRPIRPHPYARERAALEERLDRWARAVGDPAPALEERYLRAKRALRDQWKP